MSPVQGLACFIAALSLTLAVPYAAAESPPQYQVLDLGFDAVAINNQGWVVGNDAFGAVLWTPAGGLEHIGPGIATGINNFGRVVGSDASTGWVWDPTFGFLEPSGLTNPKAINDLGQVAGSALTPYTDSNAAYLWDPLFGFTTIAGLYPQNISGTGGVVPSALNNQGTVVGVGILAENVPIYWTPGTEQAQLLYGPDHLYAGWALDVNNAGQIVGGSDCPPGSSQPECNAAFFWSSFSERAQVIADGVARGINDIGWVVGGQSQPAQYTDAYSFLWSADFGLQNLNDLINPTDPLLGQVRFSTGTAINDMGSIIADNRYLLTVVTPVPEPETYAMWALGVLVVVVASRRSRIRTERQATIL